jgi:hypothetical protein
VTTRLGASPSRESPSRIASLPPSGVAMRAAALLYAAVVLVVEVAWIGALVYGAVWLVTG